VTGVFVITLKAGNGFSAYGFNVDCPADGGTFNTGLADLGNENPAALSHLSLFRFTGDVRPSAAGHRVATRICVDAAGRHREALRDEEAPEQGRSCLTSLTVNRMLKGRPMGRPFVFNPAGHSITGMENSPPSLMPEGQRAVTVLVRV
jgi:hypothetical protein